MYGDDLNLTIDDATDICYNIRAFNYWTVPNGFKIDGWISEYPM